MNVRRTVLYSGQVQGVGFRFTTRRIAADYSVTGTVRNLLDGRVEIVAEGAADELDRFLDAVSRTMGDLIARTTQDESPASGSFDDFRIAF
jgi:acylphosphatase